MANQSVQTGVYEKKSGYWVLRYRVKVSQNGQIKAVRRAKRLGRIEDFPPKRHKGKDGKDTPNAIIDLGNEFLSTLKQPDKTDLVLIKMGEFIERSYLPYVQAQKKPSTYKAYLDIWNVHLKRRTSHIWLRDVQTKDVQSWLNDIEKQNLVRDLTEAELQKPAEELIALQSQLKLRHTTLARIKSFLSGAFKHALQMGYLTGVVNPATDTTVPKGRASKETHAYELSVAQQIVNVLKEPESTIVAVAAYSGLRLGEILGLTWENYSGQTLNVKQSAWRNQLVDPKTQASQEDVPVIPALRTKLDLWKLRCKNPTVGLMFPNESGDPIDPSNLDRTIRRELKKANLPWYRFHAFRRGLATNLHDAKVDDLTIQRLLRHSDVSVTRRCYIKRLPKQAYDAMETFQQQVATTTVGAGGRVQ